MLKNGLVSQSKIHTVKKQNPRNQNTSSDELFSFQDESIEDPQSHSINSKLKELIKMMNSNETIQSHHISENLLTKFLFTINKKLMKKDSSFNNNSKPKPEIKSRKKDRKNFLSTNSICLSKILSKPIIPIVQTCKNNLISNNNERKFCFTPEKKNRPMNKSTNELRIYKNLEKEESFVSEQKTCFTKTPKKEHSSSSPLNKSTSKLKSPVMNSLKENFQKKKRRKCFSSKNLKDLKEDVLNLSHKKENYANVISKLKEKISSNKKKNSAAFFNSMAFRNQSDENNNKLQQIIKKQENKNSLIRKELLTEIQILKTDLVNLQNNNKILNERLEEEQEYLLRFKQLEEDVKKELTNQQLIKHNLRKKLTRQKKVLEITKEKEFPLIEKLQKVLQIINHE